MYEILYGSYSSAVVMVMKCKYIYVTVSEKRGILMQIFKIELLLRYCSHATSH